MAPLTIATHSGTFHADESLAVHMLRTLPEYKDARIVRTRDPQLISKADIVVDVGSVYDPSTHRYDHHQREFNDTFDGNHRIRLSSAGLIYKHFGRRVIAELIKTTVPENTDTVDLSPETIDTLFMKVYDDVIEGYDGVDNGVSQYPSDLVPAYKDSTGISHRVAALNPWWNQPVSAAGMDERFMKAVTMCGSEFDQKVQYLAHAWLPARQLILQAVTSRHNVHDSGNIIVFDKFCPWKEHLHQLETELNICSPNANDTNTDNMPLYVVYPDESSDSVTPKWRIQAIPIRPNSFVSRKPLPESWRGLRDQALSDLTGIPGCIFVHASGFIGGHMTKEGVLKMAQDALKA